MGAQVQHGPAVGVDGRDLAVIGCVDGAEGGVQRVPRTPRRQRRAWEQQIKMAHNKVCSKVLS